MAAGLPTSITVAVEFTAGVWTDISTSVKGNSIAIHVGRQDASSDSQPGTLSLDVDNVDGTFTPDNPLSTYYPNFVEGKRIRVQVVRSATTYTRFVGRITALEPDFPESPTQCVTHVTAIDSLGDLQRTVLRPFGFNVASLGPTYPLDDTAARAGAEAVTSGYADLTVRNAAATGGVDFAADSSLDVDGTAYATLRAGKGLWHAAPAYLPSSTSSPTAVGYVKTTDGSYGELFAFSKGRRSSATDYMSVSFGATGLSASLYAGGALVATAGPLAVTPGEWVEVGVALYDVRFGPNYSFRLYANSISGGSQVVGTLVTSWIYPDALSIGGAVDMSCARFSLVHVVGGSEPTTWAKVAGTSTLTSALSTLASECQVSSLSAALAWTSTPSVDVSTPLKLGGRSALEALLDIARSQAGIVYQAYSTGATQTVNVVSLADSRPTAVSLTIDAEVDGDGGPTLTRDIQGVGATAVASSTLGSVTVTDPTLGTTYGTTPVSVDTVQGDANQLYSAAADLLAKGGASNRLRLTGVAIDLATAGNDLYAAFFALTPGKRIRYAGLPSAYFGRTYLDGYAEGWTERPGVDGYLVEFDVSPADAPAEARWDTARWAFGDGVCTLSSGITAGATSATLTAAYPTNKIGSQDSLLEGAGTGNWVVDTNCTLANSTAQAHNGTHSLAQTSLAAGSMDCYLNFGTIIVSPGEALYLSAWAFKAGTARNCQVAISFYSPSLTSVGFTAGAAVSVGGSVWTFLDTGGTPVVAPAGTRYALVGLFCTAGAAAEVVFWDDMSLVTPNMLTTDASQYPLDLNVNGERVTVSSAPATCVPPQTVTVSRGVAPTVARAHSAGEAVDVWDAARWAY